MSIVKCFSLLPDLGDNQSPDMCTSGLSNMYKVGKQKVVDIMEKFVSIHWDINNKIYFCLFRDCPFATV